jgi:hypothetical protein
LALAPQQELGEVQYDRLTDCQQPVGYPAAAALLARALNLPHQSDFINDYGPAYGVYIGQAKERVRHVFWYGDTIGFWDGNKLVTSTKYLPRPDFTRWSPMTSNHLSRSKHEPAVPGRHRAARRSGHALRQVRVRQTCQRRYAFRRAKELEAAAMRPTLGMRESSNDFSATARRLRKLPGER